MAVHIVVRTRWTVWFYNFHTRFLQIFQAHQPSGDFARPKVTPRLAGLPELNAWTHHLLNYQANQRFYVHDGAWYCFNFLLGECQLFWLLSGNTFLAAVRGFLQFVALNCCIGFLLRCFLVTLGRRRAASSLISLGDFFRGPSQGATWRDFRVFDFCLDGPSSGSRAKSMSRPFPHK